MSLSRTKYSVGSVSKTTIRDGDGRLSAAEARAVREMYCHDPGIGSMEGIERFTRLEVFDCTYSYGLRGLDLSGNGNLVSVSCKDCWNCRV